MSADGEDKTKKEIKEEKKSRRTVERSNTRQEELKAGVEKQKEVENRRQQNKREEGEGGAGSLQQSEQNDADKNPDGHTDKQQRQRHHGKI